MAAVPLPAALRPRIAPPLASTGYGGPPARGRRLVAGAIVALHVGAALLLLRQPHIRLALADAAPVFVKLLRPPTPPVELPALPVPRVAPPVVLPVVPPIEVAVRQEAPAPTITVAFAAQPVPPPPAPVVAVAVPTPAPPAPAPREIPPSAVQYLVPPAAEYPRASVRQREQGLVVVRVWIDEAGLPHTPQVVQSSGFARLDQAALAGVMKARFRPYTLNGQPAAGWAQIPVPFQLEG